MLHLIDHMFKGGLGLFLDLGHPLGKGISASTFDGLLGSMPIHELAHIQLERCGLDLQWGFNNVQIQEGDKWKAAFATNQGLYESQVMFFSLCNSLATFQTMMNDVLPDFVSQGVAICYMDILIFTKTLAEHHQMKNWDRSKNGDFKSKHALGMALICLT